MKNEVSDSVNSKNRDEHTQNYNLYVKVKSVTQKKIVIYYFIKFTMNILTFS